MTAERVQPRATSSVGVLLLGAVAAFGTYFCMYAFRKPFTAASYAGTSFAGIDFKTILVVSQVMGYMVSKFLGIKVVSEVTPRRRAGLILLLVGIAELALVLFALTPPPWNAVWLFVNGLPLGMVFGLVLGVLEGRKQTEMLAAGLCTSFILADGVTKSAGALLLAEGISEWWMPAVTGLVFLAPLFAFVALLARVPAPSAEDVALRSERSPMQAEDRIRFFGRYAFGLSLLILAYLLVTILRSVRADFAPEIWKGLGVTDRPAIYAWSETVVGFVVLILSGSATLIRDHRSAFSYALGTSVVGAALVGLSVLAWQTELLSPFAFMVLLGLGLYMPYIAVHTTIFERLIAMTRDRGNIGYLMYLADAFGYLGYVAVLLLRKAIGDSEQFLGFFLPLNLYLALGIAVALIPCWVYFLNHPATRRSTTSSTES